MNKEEINVDIMSSEELEDFEYLIQNYSKSKLAYKIIKIEEESNSYSKANFELRQENKQLKDKVFTKSTIINKVKQLCEIKMVKMKKNRNSIAVFLLIDILNIIEKGEENE